MMWNFLQKYTSGEGGYRISGTEFCNGMWELKRNEA